MSDQQERPASDRASDKSTQRDTSPDHNVYDLHAPIMREQHEPRDGFEPVPPWMTILYGILLFWGGFYLAIYCGGFRADVYNENNISFAPAAPTSQEPPDPRAVGKRLFTIHCAACHQQTGKGVPGKYPPLAKSEWVLGSTNVLGQILLHGLDGPIDVLGETFNGNMPAFGTKLDDAQIAAILTFVRSEWDNAASAVEPELVTAARETGGQRQTAWTASELQALPSEEASEE